MSRGRVPIAAVVACLAVGAILGGLLVGFEPVGGDPDRIYRPIKAELARALRAGAKSISPVANQPYGVRSGAVEDDWGNQWFIATPLGR